MLRAKCEISCCPSFFLFPVVAAVFSSCPFFPFPFLLVYLECIFKKHILFFPLKSTDFKKNLSIDFFESQSYRGERMGKRLPTGCFTPQMALMPNAGPDWIWDPGASFRNPIYVARVQTPTAPSKAFPMLLSGTWIRRGASRIWTNINIGWWCCRHYLTCDITMLVPENAYFSFPKVSGSTEYNAIHVKWLVFKFCVLKCICSFFYIVA